MSRWRELARRLKEIEGAEDIRDNRDETTLGPDIVSIVPIVPRDGFHFEGGPALWQATLAQLDAATTPQGFTPARWRQLVEDARWLAERHGAAALSLGWTVSNLFGLHEKQDGWGGLADRLAGARRVHLTDTVCRWRSDEEDGWLWRKSLRPMPLIWDLDLRPGPEGDVP